ncbi:hypothetical protein [Cucumibacter marinus]|uniref:hypothetical protein n=1 Tax=Cucumibacter marinus TaxID=1121252 RepID=UPI0004171EB9|nr:hypothetical protein [Cucumibacter marinus]
MRISLRRGLTVPFKGEPSQIVDRNLAVDRIGLLGHDHGPIRAEVLVAAGEQVAVGTPVYRSRARQELLFCAPVSGTVERIEIGARRRFVEMSIIADGEDRRLDFDTSAADTPEGLRSLLLASGQWPALRARPFERIADPDGTPKALFVTAMDTAPHAPDPAPIIAERSQDFARGLAAMLLLTETPVYLCQPDIEPLARSSEHLKVVRFTGLHPAGLVGTHIARLQPPGDGETVWHIGYQDVIAIGHLLNTSRIDPYRIVSLSGPGVDNPRLVQVPLGADLHALARPNLTPGAKTILSGAVTGGRESTFLGRHDRQVTVVPRAPARQHHWLIEALRRVQTAAAFIPTQALEQTLGSGAPVTPLLRALSIGDAEAAQKLGCLHMAEEDLALASYVTGGTTDFGQKLRRVLDELEAGA